MQRGVDIALKEQLDKTPESLNKLFEAAKRLARAGNHPHVLRMFGYCSSKGYVLTEYAANGSAEDVLITQRKFTSRDELVHVLQVF